MTIHGFVENVHEIMLRSDLLIARALPIPSWRRWCSACL